MKYPILLLLVLLSAAGLQAQDYPLEGLQGLKDTKGDVYLELAGYDIFLTTMQGELDNKGLVRAIRNQHGLNEHVQAEYRDSTFEADNLVVEVSYEWGEAVVMTDHITGYLLALPDQQVGVLVFQTMNSRNVPLEQSVVANFLDNRLSGYISLQWEPLRFSFVGRDVSFAEGYAFAGPHLIDGGSKIRWSEFPTMDAATADVNRRIDAMLNDGYKVLKEGDVEVTFEDVRTLAYRVAYREDDSRRTLVVFYLAEQVRGRYVSCTMSYYADDADDNYVGPMIGALMRIPGLPPEAYEAPEPVEDDVTYERRFPGIIAWDVQVGGWFPFGHMSKSIDASPSLGFTMGYLFKRRMSVDFGMALIIPTGSKSFEYYNHGIYETEPVLIGNFNLRYQYRFFLKPKVTLAVFGGVGVSNITTDLESGYDDEGRVNYHSITSPDVFCGVNIRYKRFGAFLEYHYVPYSTSDRVADRFGTNTIALGLCYGI